MNRLVVDASIAVKWFTTEDHTPRACRLLNGGSKILAPDLIWAEFGNAIWKKNRREEMTAEEARKILFRFKRFPIETFSTQLIFEAAWELAFRLDIAIYDCLYLALALMKDAVFVTADRRFYDGLLDKMVPGRVVWVEDIP